MSAAYLSQDPVAMQEIWDGLDLHAENQKRFNLPTRVIAKTFLFQLIYCKEETAAWAFAHNPKFNHVSKSTNYWQEVCEGFWKKYERLFVGWHGELLETVGKTGKYEAIDGRVYNFNWYQNRKGEWELPKTQIYNYPVQGLGAAIVKLSRISLFRRVQEAISTGKWDINISFVNTVHDDIWLDSGIYHLKGIDKDGKVCYNICNEIEGVFRDLPANFYRCFGKEFNLPTRYEIKTLTGEDIK